jgi:hypothetical protein
VEDVTSPLKIDKNLVPVVIYTATHRIEGSYHAFGNGGRLLDDLNEQRRTFIPLTDVRVAKLQADGEVVVAKFLAVNLLSVMLFFPNPKVVTQKRADGLSRSGGELPVAKRRFVESAIEPGLLVGTVKS